MVVGAVAMATSAAHLPAAWLGHAMVIVVAPQRSSMQMGLNPLEAALGRYTLDGGKVHAYDPPVLVLGMRPVIPC